jgi:cellulose synthase operon protein C
MPMVRRHRLSLAVALSLALAGCGSRSTMPTNPRRAIDALRAEAAAHPRDAMLAIELALAEQFADYGASDKGSAALARAKALAPDSAALAFAEAEAHVLEGRAEEAFSAYGVALRRAAAAPDAPLARALAELTLHALVDMNDAVNDYRTRMAALLEELAPKSDTLGLAAAHQLALQRAGVRMQAGDVPGATALLDQAGCMRKAEVAGPFGPRAMLAFDEALPPEAPGSFAKEYALGPGRSTAPTRAIDTHRCVIAVGRGAHDALPGVSYVRSELELPKAGSYAFRVESPNSFALWVDGKELMRVDLRGRISTGVQLVTAELAAGKHEIKVKLASRHPNPALLVAVRPASPEAVAQTALPAEDSPFARYLAAKLALARGDVLGARERIRSARFEAPTAHWLIFAAGVALADPLRAPEQRRDTARAQLSRAEQANAAAWYPRVGLAGLEAAEGRAKEATDLLEAAAKRFPMALAAQTAWIEQLKQRGFDEEADRVLDRLSAELPKACALAVLRLERARSRERLPDLVRETERVMACDATANARYKLLLHERHYEAAAEELARLRSLGEPLDEAQRLDSELELAELRGDRAALEPLYAKRSALWPDRPEPVVDRADRLLAAQKRSEATAFLGQALEAHPGELGEVTRVYQALGGKDAFAGLRRDSRDVITRFEQSGEQYDGPQLLLLDYTVVRLFPDGSSVELTHNIFRVQSEEAVDEAGEFSVPEGARLLTLHTIKADGRRLEPDPISGKSSWSLPGLAVGDYVEFETVKAETPSLGFPGGYLGNRFYFKSFEVPFHRSELVVLTPKDLKLVLDPRGPAPTVEEGEHAGMRLLRWAVDKSRAMPMEPGAVSNHEYLPSINLGFDASYARYVESLRDLLSDKDAFDPEAQAFVTDLLKAAGSSTPEAKLATLHAWVTSQIEPTEDVFGSAPAMLAARTGSRERVLRYMLGLAGVPADLALARGIEADHTDGALPDPETYGYLLVRLRGELTPRWVHAGTRYAPASYLPPQLRGQRALLLTAQGGTEQLPRPDLAEDLREIDAEITLADDGSAVVEVEERQRGGMAFALRDNLDQIPEGELNERFEQSYASSILPGARLTSLTIEGRSGGAGPLVLRYTLAASAIGHRSGDELRVPSLFDAQLQNRYARMHARTTTALIAPDTAIDVRERVVLPKGASAGALPRAQSLSHPSGARFSESASLEGGSIVLSRSLRIPTARVAPADYPSFAEFCRSTDRAEATDLIVRLPPR